MHKTPELTAAFIETFVSIFLSSFEILEPTDVKFPLKPKFLTIKHSNSVGAGKLFQGKMLVF